MNILYVMATLLAAVVLYRASRSTDSIPDDAMVGVRRVLAGDKAVVRWRGREFTVCLAAIACVDVRREAGQRARDMLQELIGGRRVAVRTNGVTHTGEVEGVLYVLSPRHTDWLDVNAEMVRTGHARVYGCKSEDLPDHRCDELKMLESEARSRGLGLWQASIFGGENAIAPPR